MSDFIQRCLRVAMEADPTRVDDVLDGLDAALAEAVATKDTEEQAPPSIESMTELVEQMYEQSREHYPTGVTRDYDNAVESTQITLRTDFGVDLNDAATKDTCVRMYAALVALITSAEEDGLDEWLGLTMLGSALGAPNYVYPFVGTAETTTGNAKLAEFDAFMSSDAPFEL